MEKIKFKDLDGWLKIAIVASWVYAVLASISILVGFIAGSM